MIREPGANPFVGPKPIPAGEPLHGRSREIRELIDQLVPERIVLLYSPSGAGKTSLIQAGLLPELCQQGFVDLPIARLGQDSPAELGAPNRYVASLLLSLEEGFFEQPLPLETLMALDLGAYLDRRQSELGSEVSLLLIIDQFEEVMTLDHTDIASKREFFRQLGMALDHPRRWALFSMREDHVASLDPYLRLLPTRLRSRYRLELLSPRGARSAVQEPAARAGCRISDAAVETLVDDLRRLQVQGSDGRLVETLGPSVESVQLQVVCRRWWREEGWKTEVLDQWKPETGGDVDSALRSYYEESLREASAAGGCGQRTLRRWVEETLISPDGLRTQVLATDAAKIIPEAAREHLITNHLVRHERRRGVSWLELAHDRLVAPIRAANRAWLDENQSPLERQAALWAREGKRDELLLRGRALAEAREILDDPSAPDQSDLGRELVARSGELDRLWRLRILLGSLLSLLAFLLLLGLRYVEINTALAKARSRELASYAWMNIEDDPGLASLLALESGRSSDAFPMQSALLGVFERYPRLEAQLRVSAGSSLALSFAAEDETLRSATSEAIEAWAMPGWRSDASTLAHPSERPWNVAFDAAGHRAAFLIGERGVEVLDLSSGHNLARFELPEDFEVDCLAFWFAGDALLFGGSLRQESWLDTRRAEALLWSMEEGAPKRRWRELSPSTATSLALDPQGRRFAIGFSNGTVQIRSLDSGELPSEDLREHKAPVTALHFLRQGTLLVSASEDSTVRVWELLEGRSRRLMSHGAGVTALATDHSGRYLVSGSRDATARLWDLEEDRQIAMLEGHRAPILSVAIDPRGRRVAAGSPDGRISIWRVEDPHPSLGGPRTEDSDVAFDSRGERLSVLDQRGRLASWQIEGLRPEADPGWIQDPRKRYAFLDDSSTQGALLISSTDRRHESEVSMDQPDPDAPTLVLPHPSRVSREGIAMSSTTGAILTATEDGSLFRWDRVSGELLESRERAHGVAVCALAASPVEDLLVSSDVDGHLRLWRLDPFDELPVRGWETATAQRPSLCQLAIDPAGKVLAAADNAGGLSFWDLDHRALMLRVRLPEVLSDRLASTISSLAFDREGKLLAVGGYKELELWDVERHRQVGPALRAHENRVTDLAFSPTAPLLASSSADRVVLWDLDVEHWRQRACRLANRNLSHSEWRQYVGDGEPYRLQCPGYPVPED